MPLLGDRPVDESRFVGVREDYESGEGISERLDELLGAFSGRCRLVVQVEERVAQHV